MSIIIRIGRRLKTHKFGAGKVFSVHVDWQSIKRS